MKTLILIATILLTGCTTGLEQIGVNDGDKAVMCIRASFDGRWTTTSADYSRIELPAEIDTSTLTPELIRSLQELANTLCPR